MSVATMTTKGQITVPKAVRDQLRLKAGDRVDFQMRDDGTVRFIPLTKSVSEVFGMLARKGQKPVSVEEMHAGIGKALRRNGIV